MLHENLTQANGWDNNGSSRIHIFNPDTYFTTIDEELFEPSVRSCLGDNKITLCQIIHFIIDLNRLNLRLTENLCTYGAVPRLL